MQIIKSLVALIDSHFDRMPQGVVCAIRRNKTLRDIYSGVRSGRIKNDFDAGAAIYGTGQEQKFRMIKFRMIDEIVRIFLFLNFENRYKEKRQVEIIRAHKHLTAARLLQRFHQRHAAAKLAQLILPRARKYELTDVAFQCFDILKAAIAPEGSLSSHQRYVHQRNFFLRAYQAELTAQDFIDRLHIEHGPTLAGKKDVRNEVERYIAQVADAAREFQTHSLIVSEWRMKNLLYSISGNYAAKLRGCEEFEHYLGSRPDIGGSRLVGESALAQAECNLYLGANDLAQTAIKRAISMFRQPSDNWQYALIVECINLLHMRRYRDALSVFELAQRDLRTEYNAFFAGRWNIFGAFLRFALLQSGVGDAKVQRLPDVHALPNDAEAAIRDKPGYNTALMILRIAESIVLARDVRNADIIIDRTEKLVRYIRRYITPQDGIRTHTFCGLLLRLSDAGFSLRNLQSAWQSDYEFLCASPLQSGRPFEDIEVLPYHHMWSLICTNLPDAKYSHVAHTTSELLKLRRHELLVNPGSLHSPSNTPKDSSTSVFVSSVTSERTNEGY